MNMALPKQVERQIEEIAELEKQLRGADAPDPAAPETPAEPAPPAAETPESAPADAPVPAPEAAPASEPAKPAGGAEPWEQRYLTLKGMFDSQVPALHAKVKELTAALQAAREAVEKAKPAEKPDDRGKPLVTSDDEDAFGKDLIDLQRRVAAEAVAPFQTHIAALRAENEKLREALGRTGSDVATLTFEQKLIAAVPDFDQVNTDPKWIAWLDEIDPLTLAPRREFLEAAYRAGDVAKVANGVRLFKQGPAPAQPTVAPKGDLARQAAPARAGSPAPASAPGEKVYSAAEAARLFDRVAQLNRAGKYKEAAELDEELTRAYSTGRVR
jgi:hypothetical protein